MAKFYFLARQDNIIIVMKWSKDLFGVSPHFLHLFSIYYSVFVVIRAPLTLIEFSKCYYWIIINLYPNSRAIWSIQIENYYDKYIQVIGENDSIFMIDEYLYKIVRLIPIQVGMITQTTSSLNNHHSCKTRSYWIQDFFDVNP